MKTLQAWAERRAARAVEEASERIVREIDLPGVEVKRVAEGVELSGKRLRLRLIGGIFR